MIDGYDMEAELERARVTREAHERVSETEAYQAALRTKYYRYHHYYAPLNGDQWPEDAKKRGGKIHITVNICKPTIEVDTRLQSILPRMSLYPNGIDMDSRRQAEQAEKVMFRFLEMSDWEVWLPELVKPKNLYGKGVLKYFWNKDEKRPDVEVIENPANLRLGWGSNNFKVIDWALYEYSLSPLEAMRQFPRIEILPSKGNTPLRVQERSDHADPLNQAAATFMSGRSIIDRPSPYSPSDYERKHVAVWDYWFRDETGAVKNVVFVGGVMATDIAEHPEMLDIPYIPIENIHEPGSPEGISDLEDIIDLQYELNRALSLFAQNVNDNTDPAWQLNGDQADVVPPGLVPKGGQIVAPGPGNTINPVAKPQNHYPVEALIQEYWDEFHKISGLSEILFGKNPAAQTTGRALAVQVEAAVNRLDLKRRNLYKGLKRLLIAWSHMLEHMNPKVSVPVRDQTGQIVVQEVGLGDVVKGLRRWKIIAPEITPKDDLDNTQNVINKINSRTLSLHTGMDEMGVDNPEDEIDLIREERSDPKLFPGDVQAQIAVESAMAQLAQQIQQLQQIAAQYQQQAAAPAAQLPPGGGPPDQSGMGAVQQQQFEAQPTLRQDQNAPQPASFPGGPAAPGGAIPGGPTPTTLVRAQPTGQAQTLNQLAFGGKG